MPEMLQSGGHWSVKHTVKLLLCERWINCKAEHKPKLWDPESWNTVFKNVHRLYIDFNVCGLDEMSWKLEAVEPLVVLYKHTHQLAVHDDNVIKAHLRVQTSAKKEKLTARFSHASWYEMLPRVLGFVTWRTWHLSAKVQGRCVDRVVALFSPFPWMLPLPIERIWTSLPTRCIYGINDLQLSTRALVKVKLTVRCCMLRPRWSLGRLMWK